MRHRGRYRSSKAVPAAKESAALWGLLGLLGLLSRHLGLILLRGYAHVVKHLSKRILTLWDTHIAEHLAESINALLWSLSAIH